MSKLYELVRPKSINDSTYEDFEYLIRWIGRNGAEYIYMFYDAEINTRIRAQGINTLDEDNIQSLIDRETNDITLVASDLSKNDLLRMGEMFANKYVTRLKKDGTFERYAVDSNRYKYSLRKKRYRVEFSLIMPEKAVWK